MKSNRNKIVSLAEKLFFANGYNNVTLREICDGVKIRPASLYYHFPGGKEELYIEVVVLRVNQFKDAVYRFSKECSTLKEVLEKFGYWYIDQPPMNMMLIAQIDMPFLSAKGKRTIKTLVREAVFVPLSQVFEDYSDDLKSKEDKFLLVGAFNVLLFSIFSAAKMGELDAKFLVKYYIDLFLYGAEKPKIES